VRTTPSGSCARRAGYGRGALETPSPNANGPLRQYFPKGTDSSTVTEAELDAVAAELNERPRKCLEFPDPTELLLQ
jgi:IS30 family transposase